MLAGRGASYNPPNRFESRFVEPDPEAIDPDAPGPPTELIDDPSRSIISTNDSPDVGFDASVNPYRGCSHGCVYCMDGSTPVLMRDGSARALGDLRVGDEIIGTRRRDAYRRYSPSRVLDRWEIRKMAYRITLADGTELVAGGDHRFLTDRGWKYVVGAMNGSSRRPHLTTNNRLLGTGAFMPAPEESLSYRRGYLTGMIRGDALLASYRYERAGRAHGDQHHFRLALADDDGLARTARYLDSFGVPTRRFTFAEASPTRRRIDAIRTSSHPSIERIRGLIAWQPAPNAAWSAGFLAGMFDAEGSYSSGILRICNTDSRLIEETSRALNRMGLTFALESRDRPAGRHARGPMRVVRLMGGLRAALSFFQAVRPAIARKLDITGQALKHAPRLGIVEIEPLGIRTLHDITTATGDFISDGVVSHNCYARPTHEYLGYSAGLDFETKILVKRRAPAMLREALAKPGWKPRVVAMSGVTDPYQPAERTLEITRACLEVLRDFRNPVAVITKNRLVTRDADLLGELAAHRAAGVYLSITSLDRSLQRVMEPRTSTPTGRLEAIRALAEAGVPVGVMVAPVIPGLTDHEVPAIVQAAADAGACAAGWTMLRLPHGVKELFEDWLEAHFPDRRERALHRIREVRDGRLSDAEFGRRQRGTGAYAEQIAALFRAAVRRAGLPGMPALSAEAFRVPGTARQLGLFA